MTAEGSMSVVVHDGIGPTIDWMVATTVERVAAVMENAKGEVEDYAKENAPWADRTGDAREGLIAEVETDGLEVILTLAHSVDYGIWLETIQDGSFAIIMPTLEALGPKIVLEAGAEVMHTGKSF